ncbi:polysaccharide pyruvyl transferase family protein [Phormidium tenue FACHB-886]|nr:polysaccharide pyruvyl transferase family protein [Phormidium tenue FACHB-886]
MITFLKRPARSSNSLIVRDGIAPAVPLTWVASTASRPFANLGDALSPVLVSALSGLAIVHQHFDSPRKKLACVGTIGHALKNGTVHLWGTGVDKAKNPIDRSLNYYQQPPNTEFQVHALRGKYSARTFRQQGIEVPDVYGDPVWFLPSIFSAAPEKQYELGVIVHLSELAELTDSAGVREELIRYSIPPSLASHVRLINTLTPPTLGSLEAKVKEITSCRRIVSTSLHGLVIAEAYGIPCAYFQHIATGANFVQIDDETACIEHRFRDFYSGIGTEQVFVYGQELQQETNWEDVIRAIDSHWSPISWVPDAFLESFPLPLAFNPLRQSKLGKRSSLQRIKF